MLSSCLQRFVSEAKRTDGTSYPPKTLYQMLCGLLRYTKECRPDPPNFLDRNDARFKKLRGTCDTVFRGLHEAGVGVQKNQLKYLLEMTKISFGTQVHLILLLHKDFKMLYFLCGQDVLLAWRTRAKGVEAISICSV